MKKRVLALLLAVAMIAGMLPVMAAAATGTPELDATSLTLTGVLGVKLKYNANGANMASYSVRFTIGSDTATQEITHYTVDAAGRYVYTAKLPAHRMHESIKIELLKGTEVVSTLTTWTVASYLNAVKASESTSDALKTLCNTVGYYGEFAARYAGGAAEPSTAAKGAIESVSASDVQSHALQLEQNLSGATASLRLDDACDLRFSFTNWTDGWKLYDNDVDVTAKLQTNDSGKLYAIEELLPQDFGTAHTIKVMDGQTKKFEVRYSVLSYVYRVLNKNTADSKLLDLLKSMYLYYGAAAGIPEMSDVYYATTSLSEQSEALLAEGKLTVDEDKNLKYITYTYDSSVSTTENDPAGKYIETDFQASADSNFAKEWTISGTVTKANQADGLYLSFGVKTPDGKSQYVAIFGNEYSLQNNGDPNESKQACDNTHFWYNQAAAVFYWSQYNDDHKSDRLEYKLTLKNDVLTAWFGNSACKATGCSGHTMEKAWELNLTEALYGGFPAGSAYQLSIFAVRPASLTISDIEVTSALRGISLDALPVRDPFILEDNGTYYLYVTGYDGFFQAWSSEDLTLWNSLGRVFSAETGDTFRPTAPSVFWAPEVHKYTNPETNETAYYMFATLEDSSEVKRTAILKASSPAGPFAEFSTYDTNSNGQAVTGGHGFLTPAENECLDGTLYIENGTPYMIYCDEYGGSTAGKMMYVQLSKDLTHTVGTPVEMFKASDLTQFKWKNPDYSSWNAAWTEEYLYPQVTDGPQVFEKNGQKFLLWSTYTDGKDMETASAKYLQLYIPFSSLSDFANLTAADSKPLYENDGGHGMIFSMDGQDKLILHTPNRDPRPTLFDVTVNGNTLSAAEIKVWDWYQSAVAQAYAESYASNATNASTTLFIGDGFFDPSFWNNFYVDLNGKDVMIAGIGSSTTEDWYNYLTREIFLDNIAPKNLVVNLGNNDIFSDGLTGTAYLANSERFYTELHKKMPNTNIYVFSITKRTGTDDTTEARKSNADDANAKLKAWCMDKEWINFVDISSYSIELYDTIHPKDEYYNSVFLDALNKAGCTMTATSLADNATFADAVNVNGTAVNSNASKWDLTHLCENYVIGSYDRGTDWQPLYFKTVATDFAVEATFEYDLTQAHEQADLFAGFAFHNGSKDGYALLNNCGFMSSGWNETYHNITSAWYMNKNDTTGTTAKVAIVKQEDVVTFYINDIKVGTGSWATLSGGMGTTENIAIGLLMHSDNAATLKVSDYALYAGSEAAQQYVDQHKTVDEVLRKDNDGYYLITSAEDLSYLNSSSNKFRLICDITWGDTVTGFTGTLDGQNYTVTTNTVLFDSLSNATIEKLTINLTANLTNVSGVLAGSISNSSVTDVTLQGTGSITGSSRLVGGLVGDAGGTTFTRCTNKIAVTNTGTTEYYCAGGIAGGTYEVQTKYACTFTDCNNYGVIIAVNGSSDTAAGGILGDARTANTVISGCKNYGTVTARAAGGMAGISVAGNTTENGVKFTNCTNETDAVINGQYIGGILGFAKNPNWDDQYKAKVIISGCANKGKVENTATSGECCVGGIVGRMMDNAGSSITNSQNQGTVKGYQNTGAIIGYVSGGTYTMTGCSNTGSVYEGDTLKVELEKDSEGYYLITNAADMRALANSSDKFRLTTDITCNSTISGFAGTLDGNNKTITTTAMLFASLSNATIQNLTVTVNGELSGSGVDVGSGRYAFGALAGMATGSTIKDVTVSGTGSINVNIERYVGGLVGCGSNTSFTNCTNNIAVTNTNTAEYSNAGGILGGNLEVQSEHACSFTNCTNNGKVTAANNANHTAAGGIIGLAQTTNTILTNCTNTGAVIGQSAGGIVGLTIAGNNGGNGVQITDCTNETDAVINGQYIGGILGFAKNPNWGEQYKAKVIISGCANKGEVENTATSGECCVGGIAGRMIENVNSSISNSNNAGRASGYKDTGAIVGYQDGTCSINGCTNSGTVLVNGVEQTELMKDADGYYLISKDADLAALANSSDKFRLTANVTCSATISSFSGILDGQGKTISTNTMLFGSLNKATVQNLTINVTESLTATASNEGVGALAGSATGATITNVTVSGSGSISATCKFVGGLVGRGSGTTFANCTNSISVTNTGKQEYYNAGGILGGTWEVNPEHGCSFSNCVNNGSVTSSYDATAGWNASTYVAGGIVGFVQSPNTSITGCTNNGTVKSQSSGGIVGVHIAGANGNSGLTITNCTNGNSGVIDGQYIGGILGFAKDPNWGDDYRAKVSISACYNKGKVENTATSGECSIGGIVGRMHNNAGSVISDCHNQGTVSAYKEAGAIIGCKYEGFTTMDSDCTNTGTVTVAGKVVTELISYNR